MAGCRGTLASRASLRGRGRRVARAVGGHHGGAGGGRAVPGNSVTDAGTPPRAARPGAHAGGQVDALAGAGKIPAGGQGGPPWRFPLSAAAHIRSPAAGPWWQGRCQFR